MINIRPTYIDQLKQKISALGLELMLALLTLRSVCVCVAICCCLVIVFNIAAKFGMLLFVKSF